MKRFIAISLVCLFCAFGCAAFNADVSKVEVGICKAAAYYTEYIAGPAQIVGQYAPLAAAVPTVGPLVAELEPVVTALNAAVADLNAACVKGLPATAVLTDIEGLIVKANTLVGQIEAAGKAAVPTKQAPVAPGTVPTKQAPAVPAK